MSDTRKYRQLRRLPRGDSTGRGVKQKKILGLNPKHAMIARLRQRLAENPSDEVVPGIGEILYGLALLAEGSPVRDPARFSGAAINLLGRLV